MRRKQHTVKLVDLKAIVTHERRVTTGHRISATTTYSFDPHADDPSARPIDVLARLARLDYDRFPSRAANVHRQRESVHDEGRASALNCDRIRGDRKATGGNESSHRH
jgi:hypothetical protein